MYQLTIEDYIITKEGRIINKRNGKILKYDLNDKGYYRVHIGGKKRFVHRLVAETYIPNPNNLPQVNHINGIKTDNRVENLEWVSNLQNRKHALENRLHITGEDCSWSKLKEVDVLYIRNNSSMSKKELAKKFNVSVSTIYNIINYDYWKNLRVEKIC